jgi:hypothetical protein
VSFGALPEDPLFVWVSFEDYLRRDDPEARARDVAEFLAKPTTPPEGMVAVGARVLDARGDMPAFRERYRAPNGLEAIVWYQLRPTHRVLVQALWWPEYEQGEALAEQAFASLQID